MTEKSGGEVDVRGGPWLITTIIGNKNGTWKRNS